MAKSVSYTDFSVWNVCHGLNLQHIYIAYGTSNFQACFTDNSSLDSSKQATFLPTKHMFNDHPMQSGVGIGKRKSSSILLTYFM